MLIDTKWLLVEWCPAKHAKRFRFRHNRNVKSVSIRMLPIVIAFWDGDTSK